MIEFDDSWVMAMVKYNWIFKISIIRDLMKLNMDLDKTDIFTTISKGANISVFWGNRYCTLELKFK